MSASRQARWLSVAAIGFGILTIVSGGRALFGDAEAVGALGNVVPFVLWFNFAAGFIYVLAGAGLLLAKPWAVPASIFLAVSTVLVFLAFGIHAVAGGAYEMRTVGALTIRSLFWVALAIVVRRELKMSFVAGSR